MALINCPECGKEISSKAAACPNCGCPASEWREVSLPSSLDVGSTVTFGIYPQTTNGEQIPIEWQILDIRDRKALLISKYALDCEPYNRETRDNTWETCTLREWLNNHFYNVAFNEQEKSLIAQTFISAEINAKSNTSFGNATTDKLFLLSVNEASSYFASDGARKCMLTEYAYTHSNTSVMHGDRFPCLWRLRTPSFLSATVCVFVDGSFFNVAPDNSFIGVRPAMWVTLES